MPPGWQRRPERKPYPYILPYYLPPWAYAPYSLKYKYYPPPVAVEPRLGLHYNYPFAWQMGIQIPEDANPLYTYSLGPYTGVVRSPQEPEWLRRSIASPAAADPVDLMRAGKFREAGKMLAEEFRVSDDPGVAYLLAEVLFALGKYQHAEVVLRYAFRADRNLEAVPEDVAAHFPSREDFEKRVERYESGLSGLTLLSAYLRLHTRDAEVGLERLLLLQQKDPDNPLYERLHRHFLNKVFETAPEAGAPEKSGGGEEREESGKKDGGGS